MIPCVVSFLAGICSLNLFSSIPSLFILSQLCCIFLVLSFSLNARKFKIHWILAFCFGLLWASYHAQVHQDHQFPKALEGMPITVVGQVVSLPERIEQDQYIRGTTLLLNNNDVRNHNDIPNHDDVRFEFEVENTEPKYLWQNTGKIKLRLDYDTVKFTNTNLYPHHKRNTPIALGDRLQLTVKVKRPHGYANPGSFDKEKHYFLNRITAEGVVQSIVILKEKDPAFFKNKSIKQIIYHLRSNIYASIFNSLNNSPFAGVMAALIVGSRDGISQNQWDVFRDSGTAHLMAISGLHVGLVAAWVYGLIRALYHILPAYCFRIAAQRVSAFFSIVSAVFYAALAGFSVPTLRAVIMVSVFMAGIVVKRKIPAWHSYFFALLFVLLINPLSTLSAGFWLSFGAVGILLYGMQGRISIQKPSLWWRWGRAQWVIFLGLIPISLATFQQTSWVAPLANIIAIPWVSASVVPFALIGGILAPFFPKAGDLFLSLAEYSFKTLWPLLEHFLHIVPKATWINFEVKTFDLCIAFLGILLLLTPKGFPAKKLGFVFLLPLLLYKTPGLAFNEARFTLLDVGQGLSSVIETKNHVLIFDTGPGIHPDFSTGERVVVPFLASHGRHKIDTIIISHGDSDHIGGLAAILKKLPVSTIMTSEPEKTHIEKNKVVKNKVEKMKTLELHKNKSSTHAINTKIQLCLAGQKWSWDGVDFEMLHPNTLETKKRNDHSCVLRVKTGKNAILLTGDIEAKTEQLLLERIPEQLASSILVVPHHGSRSSSTPEFINTVKPQFALFPVGYKNAYGHPKLEVVQRYQTAGAMLFDSVKDGAISVTLKQNEPVKLPSSYRKEHQKFWHNK